MPQSPVEAGRHKPGSWIRIQDKRQQDLHGDICTERTKKLAW